MSIRDDLDRARLGQLSFDFELDEAEEDAQERAISAEEARLISETALSGLRDKIQQHELNAEWITEFLELREKGWPWRVACYIAWAASPRNDRWPETLKDLATQVLGLQSPRSIYTWRKKHPSIDATISVLQVIPLQAHRRDVIEALVQVATDPDYKGHQDRKLFFEMTGDWIPKSQLGLGEALGDDVVGAMSEAELRRWLGEESEIATSSSFAGAQDKRNDKPRISRMTTDFSQADQDDNDEIASQARNDKDEVDAGDE